MEPDTDDPSGAEPEQDMEEADVANGEGAPRDEDDATNDTEARYGEDESPA